jgi:hypothetical protein
MLNFSSFSLSNFFQVDGILCSLSLLHKSKITHHTCDSFLDPLRIVQVVPEKRMFMSMKCQMQKGPLWIFFFNC